MEHPLYREGTDQRKKYRHFIGTLNNPTYTLEQIYKFYNAQYLVGQP